MKIIKTPLDPKTTDETERKQLYFLLVDAHNEEMPCIVCGNKSDERAIFAPEEEFRYVYGLDLFDMKSIIYAVCDKCKEFANELQIRENLKQISRSLEVVENA